MHGKEAEHARRCRRCSGSSRIQAATDGLQRGEPQEVAKVRRRQSDPSGGGRSTRSAMAGACKKKREDEEGEEKDNDKIV